MRRWFPPVSTELTQTAVSLPRPGPLRRLYAWVLHWAETPYALPALIILSFTESSFFPIPPDVLLMALCLGQPRRSFLFAFWCSVASVAGGVLGYYIGYGFYEEIGARIISGGGMQAVGKGIGLILADFDNPISNVEIDRIRVLNTGTVQIVRHIFEQ